MELSQKHQLLRAKRCFIFYFAIPFSTSNYDENDRDDDSVISDHTICELFDDYVRYLR